MSFTKLYYHIVFSPKDRLPVIKHEVERDFYVILYNVLRKYNGDVIRIGGMPDHVHILISVPPSIAISKFVQAVKRESSIEAVPLIEKCKVGKKGMERSPVVMKICTGLSTIS